MNKSTILPLNYFLRDLTTTAEDIGSYRYTCQFFTRKQGRAKGIQIRTIGQILHLRGRGFSAENH